ncbi:MAG: hypothetical protein HYZ50_15560 [Deltaproteobacteria bacterium]|nr:hypothetical protein [Deltaproteobacteria bacterium]
MPNFIKSLRGAVGCQLPTFDQLASGHYYEQACHLAMAKLPLVFLSMS